MGFKTCPSCQNASYSAAEGGLWLCPCCGRDLSLLPAERRPTRPGRPESIPRAGETPLGGEPEQAGPILLYVSGLQR